MNWNADGTRIFDGEGNLIASMWEVPTSNEQEDGESWLDMRHRTHAERYGKEVDQVPRALLMAAAPELLAALQRAAESAGFQYMMHETRDVISAAIAKAAGGAA